MDSVVVKDYLNFTIVSNSGKTLLVGVGNNSGVKLGYIKWFPPWRKYAYHPITATIFDSKCLKQIAGYMDELMAERKQK